MRTDFREVLKDKTQADHERVDRLMSLIDLTTRDGLGRFLQINHSCFEVMFAAVGAETSTGTTLHQIIGRIDADLLTLGLEKPVKSQEKLTKVDPLAVDYVVEGSRLGTKVLERLWSKAQDEKVQQANAYFTFGKVPGRWRDVCDQLSAIPAQSDRANFILRDTKRMFDLFHDTANEFSESQHRGMEFVQ